VAALAEGKQEEHMTFREDALSGQHIVISGGCGALGLAIVKRLSDHGATVTINDIIDADEAQERLQGAEINAGRTHYVRADLTTEEGAQQLIDAAREKFGPVHTALCHAGMVISGPLLELDADGWDQTMAVNLRTAFLLGKTAVRAMLEDEVEGLLVFTSSWVAETPWPDVGAYNASKAGMNQLMRSFARELADKSIRANAIAPGIVNAGMAKKQWDTEPSYRERAQKAIPLGHLQPLDSIADAFLFLCSPASSYMTGTVLTVDGGCSLYPMD
jgi:NAD(P)-dependent dehydrogenase (short-subunit alcohol dehydrogenase family)